LRRARRTLQEELGLDPGRELNELEQAILQHAPGLQGPQPAAVAESARCPWKGLLVYDRDDAEWFFGRDEEVRECLRALRDSPLLVVAGPSGCGKSSMVRAGLVPALVAAGDSVTVLTPGSDPVSSLVAALASSRSPRVLVVDQLEELFTAGHPVATVEAFLDRLVTLALSGDRVLAVVRADQIGGLSSSPGMARMVERGLHLVTPMSAVALRRAVEGPSAHAGLRIEEGLVELLVREIEDEPGALPLLSHALAETWERREAGVLTVDGYRATGGIHGAVAQSAEQMWESLPPDQQATVRDLWLRLVVPTPDGDPSAVRLPLSVAAPDAERERVVDLLVRCRLVTTDDRTVSVAHEAVIRAWPRLRSWLDEDSAGLLILRHLSVAAEDWHTGGRPDSELYRGSRLDAALAWRKASGPALTPVEDEFLEAAAARVRAEQEAVEARARHRVLTNRRLRLTVVATALGLVLALLAGSVAVQRSRDASRTARDALVDSLAAESVALRATQRDLAALLAVEAHRLRPDARTRSALLGVFTAMPGFGGYLTVGGADDPGPPLESGQLLAEGTRLLGVGSDGVIRDMDLDTGAVTGAFPTPSGEPSRAVLAVSRDETTVAEISWTTGRSGEQSMLGVYDVATRARRVPDVRLPFPAGAVALSPDGRYVAVSGYDDGRVVIYDTAGRTRLPELLSVDMTARGVVALPPVGPAAQLEAVRDFAEGRARQPILLGDPRLEDPRLSPPGGANTGEERFTAALSFQDDGSLVVGSEVGIVRVVDPADGHVLRRMTGAPWLTSNRAVALSPDGSVLVTAGSRGVVGWDLGRHRVRWVADIDGDNCSSVVVEPRSTSALCGGRFSRVVSLDLATGRQTPSGLDMQHGEISALLLTADGTLVQLSRTENLVARWRLDGYGPITRSLGTDSVPMGYNADGTVLLTSGPAERSVEGWPSWLELTAISADSAAVVWHGGDYVTAAWTSHPDRLVAWTVDGRGVVVDVRDGRVVRRLDGDLYGYPPDGTSVPPGGHHLLGWSEFYDRQQSALAVWDLRTGDQVLLRTLPRGGSGSLTRDGRLVVVVQGEDDLAAYDVFGPDAVVDGPRVRRQNVVAAAVSPTGLVAASRADGRLGFHRVRSLEPVGPPLPQTPGQVEQLAFSRDGGLLAARNTTGEVRLFDTRARTQLGEPIELGLDRMRSVALRPDGRALAVRSDDGIRVWDLRPQRWSRAVCALVGRSLTREEWATYLQPVGAYRPSCS
jgi:WD40 repeat protein